MERKLKEVSVAESHGRLAEFQKLLASPVLGSYWLDQLVKLMEKKPTHFFIEKWRNKLNDQYTWDEAVNFRRSEHLWFCEDEWPFQIAGYLTRTNHVVIKKELSRRDSDFFSNYKSIIDTLPIPEEMNSLNLIRIQARYLGFTETFRLHEINKAHPKFNLKICPPITPFLIYPSIRKYYGSDATIITMDYVPQDVILGKKRFFYLAHDKGYGNDATMDAWDMVRDYKFEPNSWWIFQYEISKE